MPCALRCAPLLRRLCGLRGLSWSRCLRRTASACTTSALNLAAGPTRSGKAVVMVLGRCGPAFAAQNGSVEGRLLAANQVMQLSGIQGGTCGFGNRGQKARSGSSVRPGFEGGQTPLYRRLPKLRGIAGGRSCFKRKCGGSLVEVFWLVCDRYIMRFVLVISPNILWLVLDGF